MGKEHTVTLCPACKGQKIKSAGYPNPKSKHCYTCGLTFKPGEKVTTSLFFGYRSVYWGSVPNAYDIKEEEEYHLLGL